jgi:hypothetical protein
MPLSTVNLGRCTDTSLKGRWFNAIYGHTTGLKPASFDASNICIVVDLLNVISKSWRATLLNFR